MDRRLVVARGERTIGRHRLAAAASARWRTVERHLSNVYEKLRVSGKAGRAAAAVRFSESLRAGRHPTPDGMRDGTDAGAGDGP